MSDMPPKRRRFGHVPPTEPRLIEGVRLFNAGKFFESHEVWESLWHEVGGKERELLQGLIQLAAAYHHLSRRNYTGAHYLYAKGRAHLAPWVPEHAGIAIGDLLAQMAEDFAQVAQGKPPACTPQLAFESQSNRRRPR